MRGDLPISERFEAKVERCAMSGCWLWIDAPDRYGYGRLATGRGGTVKAHRLSYELHRGAIPPRLQVLHRCDTPACVNPAHLFLGTHAENMVDRTSKGRGYRPQPPCGSKHPKAVLSEASALDLLGRQHRGEAINQTQVAAEFGVGSSTISRLLSGKTWQHLARRAEERPVEAAEDLGPPNLDLFEEARP